MTPALTIPIIDLGDFVLRPFRSDDAEPTAAILADFEVSKWLARVPHPYEPAMAHEWLARSAQEIAAGTKCPFAIDDGSFIGNVSLELQDGHWKIGFYLAPTRWGKRIMTRAAGAVVDHAFEALGLETLYSGAFVANDKSRRIHRTLGFQETGFAEMMNLARGGAFAHVDMALTRERWRARRANPEDARQ